ncbi:DUF4255 domain-containing protein [Rhizobacter sp. P5_C2]
MIDAAIAQVANQLNNALRRSFQLGEELVVVSSPYEPDGSIAANINNKLAVFLVNLERDTVPGYRTKTGAGEGRQARVPQPVSLNLMVMFAANFSASNYPEALKFISSTIAHFQSWPVLDHQNSPDLDPRIEKLTLDIENLSVSDLSNLWGMFSGRYLPSVLYRLRMVTFDAGQLDAQLPVVRRTQAGVGA